MNRALRSITDHPRWTEWVVLIIAWFLYFVGRATYLGQWDSFDYLKQIVNHQLSDLGIGRPVFIGYNIVLWEAVKKAFGLAPLQVESVVMLGIILLGGLGVFLFGRLAGRFLSAPGRQMATLGFLLSPVYATYSGYVMTEIPMLVAMLGAAVVLWKSDPHQESLRDLAGGILFGLAVGIREQGLTLGSAFLWIVWLRRPNCASRLWSLFRFGTAALLIILAPAVLFYLVDPQAFSQRTRVWLQAIPVGEVHLWKNVEASLLFTFAVCPGAWLALMGAKISLWVKGKAGRFPNARAAAPEVQSLQSRARPRQEFDRIVKSVSGKWTRELRIGPAFWGFVCCLALPLSVLFWDADIQIHPRYALVVLPASLIFCASLYQRWIPSTQGAVVWAVLQIVVFAVAQVGMQPIRQLQSEKKQYAQAVRAAIPGSGLLIAGSYSPILDYYRGSGDRPQWRILWSGWAWNPRNVASTIVDSWRRGEPVYLCDGPGAWLYLEDQRLDLHFFLHDGGRETVAPGLFRVYPK